MASHRSTRPELSVIPDLRFEYSYLKSVGRYVRLERLAQNHSSSSRPSENHPSEEKLLEDYENLELREPTTAAEEQSSVQPSSSPGELVHVQWRGVLWFTIRDQVIAPFLQGALWGLASYYLTPISRDFGSKLSHLWPRKEGKGAEGLRKWVDSFIGTPSKSTEGRRRQ